MLHAEYLRIRNYASVYEKIYVKVVGKVLRNVAGNVPLACLKKAYNLFQSSRLTLFDFEASVFIYVGSLDFNLRVSEDKHEY